MRYPTTGVLRHQVAPLGWGLSQMTVYARPPDTPPSVTIPRHEINITQHQDQSEYR
jgi:hypothetical protein